MERESLVAVDRLTGNLVLPGDWPAIQLRAKQRAARLPRLPVQQ